MNFLERLQDAYSRSNEPRKFLERNGPSVHGALLDRVIAGALATYATVEQLAEEAGIQEGEILDQLSDVVRQGHFSVEGDGDVRSYHMVFRLLDPTEGGRRGEPPAIRVSGHVPLRGCH